MIESTAALAQVAQGGERIDGGFLEHDRYIARLE